MMEIGKLIDTYMPRVIEWRRHFHRYPELSFEEFDTSDFVAEKLTEMGYEIKRNIGGTGVLAVLKTDRKGPAIAFRADMDALPILEETGLPFESEKAGIMHACGHDGHMAVLLGTAKVLSELKDELCGTIKFIFQPGEEANGGAKCVINDGALKNPDVDGIFALHMIPDLPTGTIGIKPGYLSATDDEFVISIKGKSAHSSEPETGINAISIAAHVIAALDSVMTNHVGPFENVTFSVCQINGGEAVNIIPDTVEMKGMIRCIEKASKEKIRGRMKQIVSMTSEALGGKGEITFIPGFPSVNNDPKLTKIVMDSAKTVLDHPEDVIEIARPHMGSEDFAYYQEEVPGVMFMLGCSPEGQAPAALHTPDLVIDEDSFRYGIAVFVKTAMAMCGRA